MAASARHKGWLFKPNEGILAAVNIGAKGGASVLATNTALDGVLLGTPVTPALAVDSIVISNQVASGDFLLALNRGGNSENYIFADASAGTLTLYAPNGAITLTPTTDLVLANGTGLVVGATTQVTVSDGDGSTNMIPELQVLGTAAADGSLVVATFATGNTRASSPHIALVKGAAATQVATTAVADNEVIGSIIAYGSDSADFETPVGAIEFVVDDAGGPGTGAIGGSIEFYTTADGGETLTKVLTMDTAQKTIFSGAVDVGLSGTGYDVTFYGDSVGASMLWDQSADQLVLSGNASINYLVGAAPTNHTPISVGRFVASAASGGGFVVTSTNSAGIRSYCEATADLTSAATVRAVLGRFLNTGDFTQTAECFGVVGQMVAKQTKIQHDSAGVMGSLEAQTTAVTFSGDIGDTVAAGVLGRVGVSVTSTTIEADGVVAGVAAMSNITAGYVTVTNGGILAAFYAGQFSSKQDWDYGLYIAPGTVATGISLSATGNGADITSTALAATGRVGKFFGTHAAAAHTDGYGSFEVDITLSGSPTNHSAASSSWINITGGTVPAGTYICARNDGVYEAAAATVTNAKIVFGSRMQKLLDDTDALSFPFSLNTNNTAITALFDCNNITDFGTVANAGATAATLVPFLRNAAGTLKYVLLYDLA